jgi:hypothetical protein
VGRAGHNLHVQNKKKDSRDKTETHRAKKKKAQETPTRTPTHPAKTKNPHAHPQYLQIARSGFKKLLMRLQHQVQTFSRLRLQR